MPKPVKGNGRYMAGLDGLRAIAVLSVVAYHLNMGWAPGGLLGVGVFFVLSGYLITDILISQWRQNGRIDLKDFWLRRARRLLPAMLVMLLLVTIFVQWSAPSELATLRPDILAALLYMSNWWLIFHKVSYFASFGPLSPLGHLWSLAVEEQFYLLWPLLLVLGLRYSPKRGRLLSLTLALATASAVAMALIYQPGTDPSRVYYGTDTRAFALLIGSALAIVWPSRRLSATLPAWPRLAIDVVGGLGLLVVFFMIWRSNEFDTSLYRGGLVLASFATAMAIAALAHPAARLSRLLGAGPFRWLGVRSYGIYLWHYPVIVLTTPTVNTEGVNIPRALLQVSMSIALAALSWRFIEQPIRHGALGRIWSKIQPRRRRHRRTRRMVWASPVWIILIIGVIGVGMTERARATAAVSIPNVTDVPQVTDVSHVTQVTHINTQPPVASPPQAERGGMKHGVATEGGTSTHPTQNHDGVTKSSPAGNTGHAGKPQQADPSAKGGAASIPPSGKGVTAIGDSVMVDAAPYLEKLLPGIVADGQVGRQMYQAQAAVDQLRAHGKLGDVVVIELGTNGPFTKDQLVTLLRSLGPVKQIILVNTRVPRPWQDVVNSTLADVASSFPHTTLLDWYKASANKNSYFYPDGVHLDPDGAQYYASLVKTKVADGNATHP